MNTQIEVLESQYRTARHNRRQAKQVLDALSPEYPKTAEVCKHLEGHLFCLREQKLHQDGLVILQMLLKFEQQLANLSEPYIEASQAYTDARDAEAQCKNRLEAAKQTGS